MLIFSYGDRVINGGWCGGEKSNQANNTLDKKYFLDKV
jgi:hypothetical protein